MIWFYPYRFDYPPSIRNPRQSLLATLDAHGLKYSTNGETIKIERPAGPFFHNSWNPIFVGHLEIHGPHAYLQGHFRVHVYTLLFSAVFLGVVLVKLWSAYLMPEVRPGYVPGWRTAEINSWLTFVVGFCGITALGWLTSLPNVRRILVALRASTPVHGERNL